MTPSDIICAILAGASDRLESTTIASHLWDIILVRAESNGVGPLLYQRLTAGDHHVDVPEDVLQQLQHSYYRSAAQNTLLLEQRDRLLAALQAHVDVILLKGGALATTLYTEPALRPFNDIDLLVHRDDLDTAVEIVRAFGYRDYAPELARGLNEAASHHVHLRGGPDRRLAVELHWSLVGGDHDWRTPAMDWFWQQTVPWDQHSTIDGAQEPSGETGAALQLTPTAHLLYSAAHLMVQHGYDQARLIWFYDLHLLLTAYAAEIDWDVLLARAEAFRWASALHAALAATGRYFGTPLAEDRMAALAEMVGRDPDAARLVARQAQSNQTTFMRVQTKMSALSWPARVQYVIGHLFPRPAYMRWRYEPAPAWLWPLYYPYRWLDITSDALKTFVRTVRARLDV